MGEPVARVGLLDAARDPHLFGLDLWPAQAELLGAIDSGQYREAVIAWGRRSGKSLMAAVVAAHDALFRDLRPYLRPGERRHVVVIAASREQAGIVLGMMRDLLTGSPLLRAMVEADGDEAILVRQPDTDARVVLRALPCSARTTRGLAISTAVLDEFAHFQTDTEGPAVADRIYRAVRPSLAQFREHGRLVVISTPWGSTGPFAKLHGRAASGDHADTLAEHRPTWAVNPTLTPEFFDAERARDPELYRGEYGAEFLASGGALLTPEQIEQAVIAEHETPPAGCSGAIAGLDLAFSRDASALVVVARPRAGPEVHAGPDLASPGPGGNTDLLPGTSQGRKTAPSASAIPLQLVAARSWRPTGGEPLSFRGVLAEAAGVCRGYGVRTVVIDQFASAAASEELRRLGLSPRLRTWTPQSKAADYAALRQRLSDGTLTLYRHERLLSELARLTVHYSSGGTIHVRSPRTVGAHGDLAAALALALSGAPTSARGRTTVARGRLRLASSARPDPLAGTFAPGAVATGDAGRRELARLRGRERW